MLSHHCELFRSSPRRPRVEADQLPCFLRLATDPERMEKAIAIKVPWILNAFFKVGFRSSSKREGEPRNEAHFFFSLSRSQIILPWIDPVTRAKLVFNAVSIFSLPEPV